MLKYLPGDEWPGAMRLHAHPAVRMLFNGLASLHGHESIAGLELLQFSSVMEAGAFAARLMSLERCKMIHGIFEITQKHFRHVAGESLLADAA